MSSLTRREALALIAACAGAAAAPGCAVTATRESGAAVESENTSLVDASRAVRSRAVSPTELTRACIERVQRHGSRINAFVTFTPERALAQAEHAHQEIAAGKWRGPLHGIPIAIKANIDVAELPASAGSALFEGRVATTDAEVVARLRLAGAILLGTLNLHELGMGATSAISQQGPVRNPWDVSRIAGGSSGGSAAAVAAGFCFAALGTDTGGSIRIPAACCGVVGLKPTNGLVSNRGVLPLAASLDCVGPMARTVADVACLLRVLADHPATRAFDPDRPSSTSGLRLGVLDTSVASLCDGPAVGEIKTTFEAAIEVLRPLVSAIGPAALPVPPTDSLYGIVEAEAYALHADALAVTPERFHRATREALLVGRSVSAEDRRALRGALVRYRESVDGAFANVDLLVVPTLTSLPDVIEEVTSPFGISACTFAFNLAGLPALSMPCGFTRSGLPIGLTIAGPRFSEPRILALAHAYERATGWYRRRAIL